MVESRILSVQVGQPKVYQSPKAVDDGEDHTWSSGIFKFAVEGPVRLGETNLGGDGQADLVHHGGPDRALLIYSAEHYPNWEKRFERSFEFGSFGENFTVDGVDERQVCLGDRWISDDIEIEISQPRLPCFKLARRLDLPTITKEVMDSRTGGWYARTVKQGDVQAGQMLALAARPNPDWTIERCFSVFLTEKRDKDALLELAGLPQLSQLWRDNLDRRISQIT